MVRWGIFRRMIRNQNHGFSLMELVLGIAVSILVAYGAINLIMSRGNMDRLLSSDSYAQATAFLKKEAYMNIASDVSLAAQFQHYPIPVNCAANPAVPCLRKLNTSSLFDSASASEITDDTYSGNGFEFFSERFGELATEVIETQIDGTVVSNLAPNAFRLRTASDGPNWQKFVMSHPLCDQISTSDCTQGNTPFVVMSKTKSLLSFTYDNLMTSQMGLTCTANTRPDDGISRTILGNSVINGQRGYGFYRTSQKFTQTDIDNIKGRLMLVYDPSNVKSYFVQYIQDIKSCWASSGLAPECVSLLNAWESPNFFPNPALATSTFSSPAYQNQLRSHVIISLQAIQGSVSNMARLFNYMPNVSTFNSLNVSTWPNQPGVYFFPTVLSSYHRTNPTDANMAKGYEVDSSVSNDDFNLIHKYSIYERCNRGSEVNLTAIPITLTAYYLRDPNHPTLSCNDSTNGVHCQLYTSTYNGLQNLSTTALGDEERPVADVDGPIVIGRPVFQENTINVYEFHGEFKASTYGN